MKFVVAFKDNGLSKAYKVDDEHKWGQVIDLKVGSELDGEKILGEAYKGYTLKISGGTDENGFPMKNGVLKKGRARLLIPPRTCGLRAGREGERKRRSVRGCVVDRDIGCLHFTIVSKGAAEITGLTDVKTPRRLGPKRANKIRKLFGLPKHSDKIGSKDKTKVTVDRFDVCRYVVKRPTKTIGDKAYYKAPKIQRLITAQRLRRKREHRKEKFHNVTENAKIYKDYIKKLKDARAERKKKEDEAQAEAAKTAQPKAAPAPAKGTTGKTTSPTGPAKTPTGPAKTPTGPAKTPTGPAKTPTGPAKTTEPKAKAEPKAQTSPAKKTEPTTKAPKGK